VARDWACAGPPCRAERHSRPAAARATWLEPTALRPLLQAREGISASDLRPVMIIDDVIRFLWAVSLRPASFRRNFGRSTVSGHALADLQSSLIGDRRAGRRFFLWACSYRDTASGRSRTLTHLGNENNAHVRGVGVNSVRTHLVQAFTLGASWPASGGRLLIVPEPVEAVAYGMWRWHATRILCVSVVARHSTVVRQSRGRAARRADRRHRARDGNHVVQRWSERCSDLMAAAVLHVRPAEASSGTRKCAPSPPSFIRRARPECGGCVRTRTSPGVAAGAAWVADPTYADDPPQY